MYKYIYDLLEQKISYAYLQWRSKNHHQTESETLAVDVLFHTVLKYVLIEVAYFAKISCLTRWQQCRSHIKSSHDGQLFKTLLDGKNTGMIRQNILIKKLQRSARNAERVVHCHSFLHVIL
jgi:hypothetical protein